MSAQIEVQRELDRRVIEALAVGRIDFGISQDASETPGIVDVLLGSEDFVMVESRVHRSRRDVFLDVSPGDNTTERFLAAQPARLRPKGRLVRSFLFDEPGILLAVELGLGRAVKPRHTLPKTAAVRIDSTFTTLNEVGLPASVEALPPVVTSPCDPRTDRGGGSRATRVTVQELACTYSDDASSSRDASVHLFVRLERSVHRRRRCPPSANAQSSSFSWSDAVPPTAVRTTLV